MKQTLSIKQRFGILSLLFLCAIPSKALNQELNKNEALGTIVYEQTDTIREAGLFEMGNGVFQLQLTTGIEPTPWSSILFFTVKKENGTLSEGLFRSGISQEENSKEEENLLEGLGFIRRYSDWSYAFYTFRASRAEMEIRGIGGGNYHISGNVILDMEERDSVSFQYEGPVRDREFEMAISMMMSGDYMDNKGKMQIGTKQIETPSAIQEFREGRKRIYISDCTLPMHETITHAIYFELNDPTFLSEGHYTGEGGAFRAAFFDRYKIIYADSFDVTIERVNKKKNEYRIIYTLHLSDGRTVSGTYRGRVPYPVKKQEPSSPSFSFDPYGKG